MSDHSASLRLAQISDTHLFADDRQEMLGCQTSQSFRQVVAAVRQANPDVILLTGDLSQDETPASYEKLHQAIAPLKIPAYGIAGNHDRLPLLRQILDRSPFSTEKQITLGNWNLLLLNTLSPGDVHGVLSASELDWLDRQLQQAADRPTLIALHHHPLPIDSPWMDRINLHNAPDFLAVIDRHPQVRAVIFGHIHQDFATERSGVQFWGCPSSCVQFLPQQTQMAIDPVPAGFRLIELASDGTVRSTVQRVTPEVAGLASPI